MNKVTISSKDISVSSTARELLLHLDALLSAKGEVTIDVGDTDLEYIIDWSCVHCYARTPVGKPRPLAFIGYYCRKCDLISPCPHATDLEEPEVNSVKKYTLRLPDSVIGRSLEHLGFAYGQTFRVLDGTGKTYEAVIENEKWGDEK